MIKYKKIKKTELEEDYIICDKCKKMITKDEIGNFNYFQLCYNGGYGSMYPGDGMKIECELCEYCLKDIFGFFVRIDKSIHIF